MTELVRLDGVTKTYRKGSNAQDALKNVSLQISQGEAVAIMGPSGSGKSTLLQLVGGLDYPTSGTTMIDGQEPRKLSDAARSRFRKNTIGFVFQQFYLQPFLSSIDNVALPMRLNRVKASLAREKATELLKKVGLEEKLHSKPSELSGGEMQRVAIARALANDPKLLLADEPTGNLDRDNASAVVKLFNELAKEGRTVVVVTHDEKVAAAFDRTIHLENGEIESTATEKTKKTTKTKKAEAKK